MNRADLQSLAIERLKEANALLQADCPSGAYYLAGYAVECALKAVIATQTQQFDFPEKDRVNQSYTHDLNKLRKVALLDDQFRADVNLIPDLNRKWNLVEDWSEKARYLKYDKGRATELLEAVGDASKGVLSWIMQYW